MKPDQSIVIVGGGLAGLTAAVSLGQAKYDVTLIEQSSNLGGRARTQVFNGFYFNQGPRALYLAGRAPDILTKLGVFFSGQKPDGTCYVVKKNIKYPAPFDKAAIYSSKLFTHKSSQIYANFIDSLSKMDIEELQNVPLKKWLEENVQDEDVIEYILTNARLTTYSNDPDIASAGTVFYQMQMGAQGVLYLDGGWQSLVDGLYRRAQEVGVKFVLGKSVKSVEYGSSVKGVTLSDDTKIDAEIVVLAVSPTIATNLLGHKVKEIDEVAKHSVPVRAACLDVALSDLPNPDEYYVLGIDKPIYLSIHSKYAKLAPDGGVMMHLLKYLSRNDTEEPKKIEAELEEFLDLIQPGWQKVLVKKRLLPNMIVSNTLEAAERNGISGRPSSTVSEVDGLYIVGDWVGDEGMLAETSVVSGKKAADLIMARLIQLRHGN